MRWARGKLSYANVMATIAVFIALGGASYAVTTLGANTVGSRQVKDHSLQVVDLSKRAVKRLHGAKGARGPQGVAGVAGTAGAAGAKGDKGDKGDTGDVARWTSATLLDDESLVGTGTEFGIYADLPTPGPQVTVTVPASGLVEVFARVHVSGDASASGAVGMAIDGSTTIGVKCNAYNALLILAPASPAGDWATAAPPSSTACGTRLPGTSQSLMLSVAPGTHTFKLIYGARSSSPPATVHFSDRQLYVTPRP